MIFSKEKISSLLSIPKDNILEVSHYKNICNFCTLNCGAKSILSPCKHEICSSCIDNIVDNNISNCPICKNQISDFKWKN